MAAYQALQLGTCRGDRLKITVCDMIVTWRFNGCMARFCWDSALLFIMPRNRSILASKCSQVELR